MTSRRIEAARRVADEIRRKFSGPNGQEQVMIGLFGSVARSSDGEGSDVDIAVVYGANTRGRGFDDFWEWLTSIMGGSRIDGEAVDIKTIKQEDWDASKIPGLDADQVKRDWREL